MEFTGGLKPAGEDEEPTLIPPLQHRSLPATAEAWHGSSAVRVPAAMGTYSPAYNGHTGRGGSQALMGGYGGGGGGRGGHGGGDQGLVSLLGHNPVSSRTLAAPSDPRPLSLRTQAAEQFIIRVEREFANKADEYLEFQGVLLQYYFGNIDKRGVVDRMQVVLRGHPDLIRSFNAFMPMGYELKIDATIKQEGEQVIPS